ncbi:hypothetical protein BLA29_014091 [Euroglyphus maynei]|uniref:Uncharacterized protein n=1 Tax=Euroglyphus maynei TaxID=6958 RepID=A0A1Y3BG10_EURMA|nr:hypothetical protein BLA29_014091 [Euroglyphus maynei]
MDGNYIPKILAQLNANIKNNVTFIKKNLEHPQKYNNDLKIKRNKQNLYLYGKMIKSVHLI